MPKNFTADMAQRIALAASEFQDSQTGHMPLSATVVLNAETLVITLQGALSEAEQVLLRNPDGANRVQEFHRQLFNNSVRILLEEIKFITGVAVREAAAEIETTSGSIIHAFASGAMVQVFLLNESMSTTNRHDAQSGDGIRKD